MKTDPRQPSSLCQIFQILSKIVNYVGLRIGSKKILIYLINLRKIGIFCQNLGFLTYVNFSLSAKFNRFFIILGGIEEKDQKLWFFKKPRKNVVFRGFSWFLVVLCIDMHNFKYLIKSVIFNIYGLQDREELGWFFKILVVIYVFLIDFIVSLSLLQFNITNFY